jgi:two-component system sensor histidine kinase AlgZ
VLRFSTASGSTPANVGQDDSETAGRGALFEVGPDGASPPSRSGLFRTRVLVTLGLNVCIGLLMAVVLWAAQPGGKEQPFASHLAPSFIHAGVYGASFGLLMPYLGERVGFLRAPWNWITIAVSLLMIAAGGTAVIQVWLLELGHVDTADFWPESLYKGGTVLVIAAVIAVIIGTYDRSRQVIQATTLQLRTQQLEKERALKLATEARLSSLESRLHPHFLFNTLNSIAALITEDPALAEQTVQRLATLLRTSLDACSRGRVPLRDELDLVVDYLEIAKTRFRERLSYSIDVAPGLEQAAVPPLVLQPLVENSVKYAVSPSPAGAEIRISARLQSGHLVLIVQDTGPGFTADMIPHGHGIDTLQSRLNALCGEGARLSITLEDTGTHVAVLLPVEEMAGTGPAAEADGNTASLPGRR